ncbi:MAG: AraC family transcriptional regulator [Bacteroidota bacterium]
MQYISVKLYQKMTRYARTEGLSEQQLAQFARKDTDLQEIEAVPADDFFALHEQLDRLLGPGFAVRVGQQMKIEDYGVLGLSWRTCSQAMEIYVRSERYFKLLSNTYVFEVVPAADETQVLLHRAPYRRGVGLSNEATFSASVVVLRAMTETNISPLRVAFQHDGPADQRDYAAAFQCPVSFKQAQNVLTYRTEDLQRPTAKADFGINQFLVEQVAAATANLKVGESGLIAEVDTLIRGALPGGIPAMVKIGQQLGMSNRTLTRRLTEEGVTFRELVQRAQESLARQLLRNTSQSMAEIAFQTGFSEQSAFSRAFKRWTGKAPVDYRMTD